MTRISNLLLALPLVLATGCNDPTNSGNDGNVDTGDDGDGNFEAKVYVSSPDGEPVDFFLAYEDGFGLPEAEDAIEEHIGLTECIFDITEPHDYYVWIDAGENYVATIKEIEVTKDDDGSELSVEWAEGGCVSDPNWAADGPCDDWQPGEYAFPMLEGDYTNEVWDSETYVTVEVGNSTISVEPLVRSESATFGMGNFFYTVNEEEKWQSGLVIDKNTFQLLYSKSDGSTVEMLFLRD